MLLLLAGCTPAQASWARSTSSLSQSLCAAGGTPAQMSRPSFQMRCHRWFCHPSNTLRWGLSSEL